MRADHELARAPDPRSVSMQEFLAYPHILVSVFGGRTGVIDNALAQLGKRRRIAVWLPYFAAAAMIAAQTDMILTLPTRAALQLATSHGADLLKTAVRDERTDRDSGFAWLRRKLGEAVRMPG